MSGIIDAFAHQGPVFSATFGAFAVATALYAIAVTGRGGDRLRAVASWVFLAGFVGATAMFALRWVEAGRPPFKTLHESLVLLAWCTALVYAAVERSYRIAWLGLASCLGILVTYGYAMAKADAEVVNLPAALQSAWFIPHVLVYFFGYAALFMAFAAAILYLVFPNRVLKLNTTGRTERPVSFAGFMHLAILMGFVNLTLGLVIGGIWAKTAWGDYWTWDPKESWALVSWLIFVIYLHIRYTKGYSERTGAIVTIVGFLATVFTYLGMHLLPTAEQSVHLYQ